MRNGGPEGSKVGLTGTPFRLCYSVPPCSFPALGSGLGVLCGDDSSFGLRKSRVTWPDRRRWGRGSRSRRPWRCRSARCRPLAARRPPGSHPPVGTCADRATAWLRRTSGSAIGRAHRQAPPSSSRRIPDFAMTRSHWSTGGRDAPLGLGHLAHGAQQTRRSLEPAGLISPARK